MGIIKDFKQFLKEYKIIGLAVAFIMGVASTALIKALVEDIIMPLITPFIPGGAWQDATLSIGPIVMKLGAFAGEVINFIIIAFVVFIIVKIFIREEKAEKK